MSITRIKNNQITDLTVNAAAKLQDYSITSGKIANNLTYNSNLTIAGNLDVTGQTTTIDTVDLVVEDPLILLAKNQTGSPALDIGFIGKRGTEDNIAFVWDESADEFVTVFTTSEVTNTVITINSYASFRTANLTAANGNITGNLEVGNISFTGNIDGNLNVTGNVAASNFLTTGTVSATGTITGGNVATSGTVSATGTGTFGNVATSGTISSTGTATVGNLATGGTISSTGTATLGNIESSGTASVTGNITGGNINTAGAVSATGNVNSGNLNTTGVFSSTVSVSGNVDSGNLNTAGVVSATGNVIGGNINTAGVVSATGNVIGGNITTTGEVSASGNITTASTLLANTVSSVSGDLVLTGTNLQWDGTGNIVMNSQWINNLSDPVQAQDAATKEYVDNAVSTGLTIHQPVQLCDTDTPLNGTYAQGGTTATVTDTIAGNTVVFSSAIDPQPNDQLWFTNSFNGILGNVPYFVVSAPNTSAAVLSRTYSGAPVTDITDGSSLTESVRINSGQGATLTNNNTLAALVIDGVTVEVGYRVLLEAQTNAFENGVYEVTEVGNVTTAWELVRSQDTDTYIPDNVNGLDAGDYFYVELGDNHAGESHVMTAPIGPVVIGYDDLTFTQFSKVQVYTANTAAGLVLNGTVFSAKVDNNTTAFDGNGNIIVKAGANLTTPNIGAATGTSLSTTGNVDAGNMSVSGNVTASYVIATNGLFGNINLTGDITVNSLTSNTFVSATGNVIGGNVTTVGLITATGNITGGNLNTAGAVSATGNVNSGNLNTTGVFSTTVSASGNVIGGNITTAGVVSATGNVTGGNVTTAGQVTATGTITGGNLVTTGNGNIGNVRIAGDDITGTNGVVTFNAAGADVDFAFSGDTVANVFYIDAGTGTASFGNSGAITNAVVSFNTTNSIKFPVGNIAQRPDPATVGMVRFSTTSDALEVYTTGGWEAVGVPEFTVVVADEFTGDGSTLQFTLTEDSTTAGTIVSINGVVQNPVDAYAVSGNVLTFTEAPESTDVIDARIITTTTTVTGISNTPGNAAVSVEDTSNVVTITGQLSVTGGILGLSADKISNGTSNVEVIGTNGNVDVNVDGNLIVTFYSGGIDNGQANGVGNIGTATSYFNTIFATATSAQYADLAEMYEADQIIEPGTVVCFGGSKEVTVCDQDSSARVAGVISTNPSYIMNAGLAGEHVVAVALTGRVPTRVTGTVRKGDMMVSAGDGRARAEANPRIGTVIGKALADFDGTDGVIEVVIGRL